MNVSTLEDADVLTVSTNTCLFISVGTGHVQYNTVNVSYETEVNQQA